MSNQPLPGWQPTDYPVEQPEAYGEPFVPPPDQHRKRVWPWLIGLLLLLAAMLLSCGTVFALGAFYLTRGPITATNTFVAHIDDGEYEDAYESLCTQTRQALTLEEFAAHFASGEQITGYTFSSVSATTGGLTMVSGTIELEESPEASSFGLREEDDVWKVCTYDVLPDAGT